MGLANSGVDHLAPTLTVMRDEELDAAARNSQADEGITGPVVGLLSGVILGLAYRGSIDRDGPGDL